MMAGVNANPDAFRTAMSRTPLGRAGTAREIGDVATCNTCYNCVDRHVEAGHGDQTAVIHDSPAAQAGRGRAISRQSSRIGTPAANAAIASTICSWNSRQVACVT